MSELEETLRARLAQVRARVDAAARRAGRDPREVRIVAVTKTVGPESVVALARIGHADFGENRPQDLVAKREALAAAAASDPALRDVRPVWHMIGHFQRNKVRRCLPAADLVHSVDSLELAETIAAEAIRAGRAPVPVLLQVNVSGESSKGGFAPDAVEDALRRIGDLPALAASGLMTMAPWSPDPEASRPVFHSLRDLRDWARSSGYLRGAELSMGMSEDLETAVEEGATIVRVGRALVGPYET